MIIKNSLSHNKSNYFLSVLIMFIIFNYPLHDLGIDKVFYCFLCGYPIVYGLKYGLKTTFSTFKVIYLIISLLVFLYASLLPNQYSMSDLIIYLRSFSIPIVFFIYAFYIFYAKVSLKEIKRLSKIFLYFGLVISLIMIFFKIFPDLYLNRVLPYLQISDKKEVVDNLKMGYGIPIGGSITYPCIIASICLFICFATEFLKYKTNRFSLRIFEFFYLTAFFCQGRRTEALCIILALLMLYHATIKSIKIKDLVKYFFKLITIILISSITIIGFSQLGLIKRFAKTADSYSKGSTINSITSGRIFLWALAFNNFIESPVFGKGWRFFPYYSCNFVRNGKHLNVHNTYLQFLCETGIVGAICIGIPFLILYFYTFKLFKRFDVKKINNSETYILFLCICISLGMQTFYGFTSFMDNHFYKALFSCVLAINIILADFVKKNIPIYLN